MEVCSVDGRIVVGECLMMADGVERRNRCEAVFTLFTHFKVVVARRPLHYIPHPRLNRHMQATSSRPPDPFVLCRTRLRAPSNSAGVNPADAYERRHVRTSHPSAAPPRRASLAGSACAQHPTELLAGVLRKADHVRRDDVLRTPCPVQERGTTLAVCINRCVPFDATGTWHRRALYSASKGYYACFATTMLVMLTTGNTGEGGSLSVIRCGGTERKLCQSTGEAMNARVCRAGIGQRIGRSGEQAMSGSPMSCRLAILSEVGYSYASLM